jgi:5-carboxymethyl-2-hydroxymuconate isomerase
MPHLSLETTADLPENSQVPDILEALTAELSGIDGVAPASVKAYHTLRSVWVMGEGAPPGFAHLTVAVLSGRPLEWRQHVSAAMFEAMRAAFAESLAAEEMKVTVELREMDRETYMR